MATARVSVLRSIATRVQSYLQADAVVFGSLAKNARHFASAGASQPGSSSSSPSKPVFNPFLPQTFRLDNLRDNAGAKKVKRKKGRGVGGGHGLARSAGEGSKGTKSHQGGGVPLGFEGGQSPLWRRTPKFGYMAKVFRREMDEVNLDQLQMWIDQGRINPAEPITIKTLVDAGLANKVKHGIKLLGNGAESFKSKVNVVVSQASKGAIKAIEAAGGSIMSVYMTDLAVRAVLKPHKFDIPIRSPLPPPRLKRYYLKQHTRGYLNPEVQLAEVKRRLAGGVPLPLAAAVHPVFIGGAQYDPHRHILDIQVNAPAVVAGATQGAAPAPGPAAAKGAAQPSA